MLNVSHTTVSRSLNDSPLISKETKEKVRALAYEYQYAPNFNARSLVQAKTYNIGLFFSTLKKGTSANFFMETIQGVNSIIKGMYNLSVEGLDDFDDLSLVNKRYFDGVLIMSQSAEDDRLIKHLKNHRLPFVLLNRASDIPRISTVLADDKTGAYKATACLIEKGHSRIAAIMGRENFKNTERRKEGFDEALSAFGIQLKKKYVSISDYSIEGGYEAMQALLKIEPLPTAVFCFNDDMAVGAMKAVYDKKLRVPHDISIIGFDDSAIANYLVPALTTVSRPIKEISIEGARILLDKINGMNKKNKTMLLKTELKERDSVKKINV